MFMNSNALPIALMQSLVLSVPDLQWGSDDNKDMMLGRSLTYLALYSTLGMVVRPPSFLSFYHQKDSQQSYSSGIVMVSNSSLAPIPSRVSRKETPKNVLLFLQMTPPP